MGAPASTGRAGSVAKKHARRRSDKVISRDESCDQSVPDSSRSVGETSGPTAAKAAGITLSQGRLQKGRATVSVADFDQTQLWKQINDCLDRLCGKTVIEQLVEHGHDEIVAQRACLEVFQSQQHVSLEAAESWIGAHGRDVLPIDRTLDADDCTKYQDIALAVAKVACLASCATQDADAHTLYSALGASQPAAGKAGCSPKPSKASEPARLGKAWKAEAASGSLSPRLLLQTLPPSVWSNLQESTGEMLQAMTSAEGSKRGRGSGSSGKHPSSGLEIAPGITCITLPLNPTLPQHSPPATASHLQVPSSHPALAATCPSSPGASLTLSVSPVSISVTGSHPGLQADVHSLGLGSQTQPEVLGGVEAALPPMPTSSPLRKDEMSSLAELEAYKDWAKRHMSAMIARLQKSERDRRDDTARVRAAAAQLVKEKELLEERVKDYADGLVKLKEASYLDDRSRDEGQRALETALAELRGAALREQELAAHVRNAATQVKSERKRREGAEKELKAAHEARTQAAAAAAKAGDQIQAQQAEMDRWQKLAEERSGLVVQAENAAIEMRQACDKQVRKLQHQAKAQAMEAQEQLALSHATTESADATSAHASAQVVQLQMQLAATQQELAEHISRADSCSGSHCSGPTCYDHWTGSSLFAAEASPMGPPSTSHLHSLGPHTPPRTHSPRQARLQAPCTPPWLQVTSPSQSQEQQQQLWSDRSPSAAFQPAWGMLQQTSSGLSGLHLAN